MAAMRDNLTHDFCLRGIRPVKNFFSSVPTASTSPKVISPPMSPASVSTLTVSPGAYPVLLAFHFE